MRNNKLLGIVLVLSLAIASAVAIVSCQRGSDAGGGPGTTGRKEPPPDLTGLINQSGQQKLVAFSSEADLQAYFDRMTEEQRRERAVEGEEEADDEGGAMMESAGMSAPSVMSTADMAAPAPEPSAAAAPADGESITNVQEAGVDEGGIVKPHGEHLVVLRRGRLFSIGLEQGQMRPISIVDAYPPGGPPGDWYDEMLIRGDTIIVVGYNYQVTATELGFFDIDRQGTIRHRKTYYLRSYDYYSSSNYASRLIGDTLIFYMPLPAMEERYQGNQVQYVPRYPAIAEWHSGTQEQSWRSIMQATAIYQPVQPTSYPLLHTVVTCDLGGRDLRCSAQGILGPEGRTFYVSPNAVYVWTSPGYYGDQQGQGQGLPPAAVYRLPLRGGAPGALRVWGVPTDQFSFKESNDGYLNVLVRSEGGGDAMWGSEVTEGAVALMRVPVGAFDLGVAAVMPAVYAALPQPEGYEMQNRFIGDYVLYGTGSGWTSGGPGQGWRVFIHPYRVVGAQTAVVPLPHGVDRIEAMGRGAVVIGTDGQSLHFSAIALGSAPAVVDRYIQQGASQGELRSHGFFYRPDNPDDGVLGLPVRGAGGSGAESLTEDSAGVLYLQVRSMRFSQLGSLFSRDEGVDDQCVASCADWYGNARPLFYRGRVFALLGYELVEGRIDNGRILEIGRTNFYRGARPTVLQLPR